MTFNPADPSRSYFGTDARIHQLLVGCLLALVFLSPLKNGIVALCRRFVSLPLIVLLAAFALVSDTSAFYYLGGAATFGVVVAVLVVGLESESSIKRLLSTRSLVWVGKVSYGLYLWHWPIIQWLDRDLIDLGGVGNAVLQAAATVVAATISFYALELPIRRGQWLGLTFNRHTLKRVVPVLTGSMALLVLTSLSAPIPDWMLDPLPAAATEPAPSTEPAAGPDLDRPIVVGAVGDSVMVSLLPGLREFAAEHGWALIEGALPACPIGLKPVYVDGVVSPYYESRCRDMVPSTRKKLVQSAPDVILWHDLQSTFDRMDGEGRILIAGSDAWAEDLNRDWQDALTQFEAAGSQILIVLPPLRSQDPPDCLDAALAQRCLDLQAQDRRIREATETFIESNSGRPSVHWITIDYLLCPNWYPCPSEIDGIEVRLGGKDQTHFSEEGAVWLMDHIAQEIMDLASLSE